MPITKQQRMSATKKLNIAPTVLKGRGAPPGSGHVSKTEILQRMIENDAVRFLNGRFVDPDGNNIDPYEFTWAEFLTLVSTDYAGITIRITDRHQDSRGVGGILVTGGASWTLESPQIYYSTFASAPDAVSYPGWRITGPWAGKGAPVLESNGTAWRYKSGSRIILGSALNVSKTTTAGAIYTEEALLTVQIPINNGKSLLQPGDRLFIDHHATKTGTDDKFSRDFRFGTSATPTSNTSLDPLTASSASATTGIDEMIAFRCIDDTNLLKEGPSGFLSYHGGTNTGRSSNKSVTSIASALQYFSCTYNLTSVGGTDTAQKLESAIIYIEHCG